MNLAYVDYGTDHSKPPVVLLHAFPLFGAMFEPVAIRLAGSRRVLVPDLRGFGASPEPGTMEPSVDVMADDIAVLLDRLDIERAVIGGISMGGYVVMAMLRRHRVRVAGVILIDTKASKDDDAARADRERMAKAVLTIGPRALRPMLGTLLGPTTHRGRRETVDKVRMWIEQTRPEAVAWAQRAMAARPSSTETLSAAGVAGVVVVGAEDSITTSDDALAMSVAFQPPAPVHVIVDAGHLSPVENPDAVADVLRDALDGMI